MRACVLIAALLILAAGCASGTLGKLTGSDELPKDLSADQKQKFEVMERPQELKPLPQASPSPLPTVQEVKTPRKEAKKRKKHGHKARLAADETVAAPSPTPVAIDYPNRRPLKEPVWTGEKLSYDVSYFGVSAGQFVVESLPHKTIAGREVYHIKGTAETSKVFNLFYRLNDTVETFVDFQGFFSHRFHIVLDESKQSRDALELYDAEKAQTFYWNRWNRKEGFTETKEFDPIPRFSQDSLSVLYYLRVAPMPDGAVISVPVVSEGKTGEWVVTVMRREMMHTPMGKMMTIVVKPETRYQGVLKKQGDSFLWLTDDDRRIPIRLEAKVKVGTVVANLTDFTPGTPPSPIVLPTPVPTQGAEP